MRKKKKLFIVVGSICILVLAAAIFLNYKMGQIVRTLNRPGLVFSDPGHPSAPSDYLSAPHDTYEIDGDRAGSPFTRLDLKEGPAAPPRSGREQITKDAIIQGVQDRVGRPIDKKDLIKAGLIIIRRLSWSEIEYMYETGSKSRITTEELRKIHEIICARLTADEIKVMQELARKYGKNLDFLSVPSVNHSSAGSQ